MKTLAFDGRMGASGDMLLGALLAAGADSAALDPVVDALGVRYAVGPTTKAGIAATTVDVVVDEESSGVDGGGDDHPHDHSHAEGHGPERTYADVVALVESMGLPSAVERDALAVFRRLGEAEASVHGTDLDDTGFHEVGADDAVADVVGVCLLLDDLGVDRAVTTPVSAGSGTVEMSHGTYPVPAPAVVELAADADWSLRGGPVERELLTPTGAALLAELAAGAERLPPLDADAVGYGAGDADVSGHPNVLRVLVGDGGDGLSREPISVLETAVDDVAPEVLGSLQETLADAGARDVTIVPTTMKKSRPGHLVKVVVDPADADAVARRLAAETGTLGVREAGAGHRWVADRRFETATLEFADGTHEVRVKIGSDADGVVYDVSAEYDDALAVARETGLPTREVVRRAEAAVAENADSAAE
ncbi:MAG: nickel pincer cofactor biosynthesis protein LarC [Haloplanus sp.]